MDWVRNIVKAKHNLTGPPATATGDTETYDLGGGRVLRLGLHANAVSPAVARQMVGTLAKVYTTSAQDALVPLVQMTPHTVAEPDGLVSVVTESISSSKAGPSNPSSVDHKMLLALFDAALKLKKHGVLPRNVTPQTVRFDPELNEYVFDTADACVMPASMACTSGTGRVTAGFALPEDESPARLASRVGAPPMYDVSPLKLEHALVHALVCISKPVGAHLLEHTRSLDVSRRLTLQQARASLLKSSGKRRKTGLF